MDNVTFVETTDLLTNEIVVHAIIDHGNGEFTSMLKSTYDEQQATQAMPQFMPEVVEIIPEETQILPEEVQAEPVIPEA
jgi:hypothetical protein